MRIRNGLLIAAGAALLSAPHAAESGRAKTYQFPAGFKWCAATAAHQIEGYNFNSDWWAWETLRPCKVKNCENSRFATDHWNRVDEDVQLMRDLNVGQYRFSVEWAKIEPREGQYDAAAIEHYRNEVRALLAAGIEPMITLQHFTLPYWLAMRGGWNWRGMPAAFRRYTELVYTQIAPGVRDWVTVNEPVVHIGGGYALGQTPPGLAPSGGVAKPEPMPSGCRDGDTGIPMSGTPTPADLQRVADALKGVLKAHVVSYETLHRLARERSVPMRVGMAHHLRVFDPRVVINPLDWVVAGIFDGFFNWSVPNALASGVLDINIPFMFSFKERIPGLRGTQDFFGLNYYTRNLVWMKLKGGFGTGMCTRSRAEVNDLGWELYPHGIYRLLKTIAKKYPRLPVLITENGIADRYDTHRAEFLKSHLKEVHAAIREGVPVQAYCHWSLLDNFEWVEGYFPRFGLYETNYSTMERTLRPSGRLYSQIAGANSVTD